MFDLLSLFNEFKTNKWNKSCENTNGFFTIFCEYKLDLINGVCIKLDRYYSKELFPNQSFSGFWPHNYLSVQCHFKLFFIELNSRFVPECSQLVQKSLGRSWIWSINFLREYDWSYVWFKRKSLIEFNFHVIFHF